MKKLLIALLLCLSSCAATKGYVGPELPDSEVATVYFFSRGIDVKDMRIDQTSQGIFDMGIKVLPGEHNVVVDFTTHTSDCYYQDPYCLEYQYEGYCRASLRTDAGQTYHVEIFGTAITAVVSVQSSDGQIAGSGDCNISIPRWGWPFS